MDKIKYLANLIPVCDYFDGYSLLVQKLSSFKKIFLRVDHFCYERVVVSYQLGSCNIYFYHMEDSNRKPAMLRISNSLLFTLTEKWQQWYLPYCTTLLLVYYLLNKNIPTISPIQYNFPFFLIRWIAISSSRLRETDTIQFIFIKRVCFTFYIFLGLIRYPFCLFFQTSIIRMW